MCYILWVNVVQRDADHSEYSKNILLWNELFWKTIANVCKILYPLFHNDARKIILIFDKINYSHNHGVIDTSHTSNFFFGCFYHLTWIVFRANLKLESLGCVEFLINFRLDLEQYRFLSFFDNFVWIKLIVFSP